MRLVSVLCICMALVLVASAAMADPNNAGMKSWTNDRSGARATYAEVEPNDTCPGQQVACGDDVNPAFLEVGGADWYTFTANAGDLLTLQTYSVNGSSVDTYIELYSDNCATLLAYNDDNPYPFSMITNFNAPYTGVYNLKVRGYSSSITGDYGVAFRCVGAPPPQEGDTCATAYTLPPCSAGSLAGDLTNYANNYNPPAGCTGYSADGKDVVYKVDMNAGDSATMTYVQPNGDASLYVVTDCVNLNCIDGADAGVTGDPETVSFTAASAGTYYFILDTYGTGLGGPWTADYTITCPVPEACCFTDGTCTMLLAGDCRAQGGTPQGVGTVCDPNPCHVVPTNNTTWGQIKSNYR